MIKVTTVLFSQGGPSLHLLSLHNQYRCPFPLTQVPVLTIDHMGPAHHRGRLWMLRGRRIEESSSEDLMLELGSE